MTSPTTARPAIRARAVHKNHARPGDLHPLAAPGARCGQAVGAGGGLPGSRRDGGAGRPRPALDGIDLDVAAGALTVVMGASGSGKSTLLDCLAGLDVVTSGSIAHADPTVPGGWSEITAMSADQLASFHRGRVGVVRQSCDLLSTLSVEANIALPLDLGDPRLDRARVHRLADVFGLTDVLGRRPGQLSDGQQQRVACARALVTAPGVLLADEPAGDLDSRATAQLLSFLRRSVRELGQTVVLVTHDANAATHADRVVLLAHGRVAGQIESPTPAGVLEALLDLDLDSDVGSDPDFDERVLHLWNDLGVPAGREGAAARSRWSTGEERAFRPWPVLSPQR